jgi:hypothetical protein
MGFFNASTVSLPDGTYSFSYVANKSSNEQWFHISDGNIGYLLKTQPQYFALGIELDIKSNNYDTFFFRVYSNLIRVEV